MRRSATATIAWALCLVWMMVCATAIYAAPTCRISAEDEGPPLTVVFVVQDIFPGLKQINVMEQLNATVNIPFIGQGVTNPINVTATRINANADFRVVLEAVSMDGSKTTCQKEVLQGSGSNPPPTCQVTAENPGPPVSIEFTIQDSDDGLKSIEVTSELNADVNIPAFTAGTKNPVLVTVTQVQANQDFAVSLLSRDMGNGVTTCAYNMQAPEDDTPPVCMITNEDSDQVALTVSDSGSGLKSINVNESFNAQVDIPSFSPGTTEDVTVTVARINDNLDFSVVLESRDVADNLTTCQYPRLIIRNTRSEFDAVGNDSNNFFRDWYKDLVIVRGIDGSGKKINDFSDFLSEEFTSTSGDPNADPCFSVSNRTYESVLTTSFQEASYEWEITLQMTPLADISLNMVACVLQAGEDDPWTKAQYTGLGRLAWAPNTPVFFPNATPALTVKALPGPFATPGFPADGIYLDARQMAGLSMASLQDNRISLQALVEQGIVIVLPHTGSTNTIGQTGYALNRGDRLRITLSIPPNNTASLRLGRDNVILKYIGIIGTEYMAP